MRKDKIRVVQYGCGLMSKVIMRYLYEHDVEIVGAIDVDPQLVGVDIGQHMGLSEDLGIVISDDADEVLGSSDADVAIVTTFSYMKEMYPFLEKCAEYGVNVITTGDEAIYPWNTSPMETNRLDLLAKENDITIMGTGMQDIYWIAYPALMAAGCNQVDKIKGTISYNIEDYGLAGLDFSSAHLNFNEAREAGAYLWNSGWNSTEALCARLKLSLESIHHETKIITLEEDMESLVLEKDYQQGDIIGVSLTTIAKTQQGIDLEVECIAKIFNKEESDLCVWEIIGEPDLKTSVERPDTVALTCGTVLNRIPSVIKAEPGYVTAEKMEDPAFHVYPMHLYL